METGQPPAPEPRSTRAAEETSSGRATQRPSLLVKCAGGRLNDRIVIENFATGGVDCAKAELTVSSIYC